MDARFLLDWAVLGLSFYIAISLLWLGVMVILIGNRGSAGTWLTSGGLLVGALFFTSHTAILGRGLATTGLGMNFWWVASWIPAAVAPLAWYGAMLWHTGFRFERGHPHRTWLLVVLAMIAAVLFLLIFANPLPEYHYVAGRTMILTPSLAGIPLLILFYISYSILSYLLPLDLLRRPTVSDSPLLDRSRQLARPWLIAATLCMFLAGVVLSWTALWALIAYPAPSLSNPLVELTVLEFDLAVETLVALAITLLGRAIVAYEVFTGRPMPRDRFFYQWRSAAILAAGFGLVAAWTLVIDLRPIYTLMLATALMTIFYALFAWRSYAEREAFMSRLRPFVASQNLYARLTEPVPAADQSASMLFESLCREILGAQRAVLAPAGALATLAGLPLAYASTPGEAPQAPSLGAWVGRFTPGVRSLPMDGKGLAWAVPLWSERGLGGVLFLGEKETGNPYTEEEIELAQAGGERLLDMIAGSQIARLSLELLRQRVSEARVLEGQSRRVLHDEVLPELHTALLYLNGMAESGSEVKQAVDTLAEAHRRISDLLRATSPGVPARLAQEGLPAALQALLTGDLAGEFREAAWHVDPAAAEKTRQMQPFAAEVVYFAARELLRNAARYANGGQEHRPRVTICLDEVAEGLRLVIEDDGVGMAAALGGKASEENSAGAGSGLRIHSAMLAAIGASLEVSSPLQGGTRGEIHF
jgi:signal transduction histidine kinase